MRLAAERISETFVKCVGVVPVGIEVQIDGLVAEAYDVPVAAAFHRPSVGCCCY